MAERIAAIWERSRRTYGAPRIHAMLAREGLRVGRKRVERLMRQLGIQGAHLHKHWKPPGKTRAPQRHPIWSSGISLPLRIAERLHQLHPRRTFRLDPLRSASENSADACHRRSVRSETPPGSAGEPDISSTPSARSCAALKFRAVLPPDTSDMWATSWVGTGVGV
jgi:hypothetical protein